MTAGSGALDAVLRRDRVVVLAALGIVVVLAWAYVLWLAAHMAMPAPQASPSMDITGMKDMPGMSGMKDLSTIAAPAFVPWPISQILFVFAMWAVMMIGMMTPSAAPMVLTYAAVARQAAARGTPFASSAWFALGYLLAWTWFAVLATSGQYMLDSVALLTPMMSSASRILGGAILIAAGLYQWTPLKEMCLAKCRAPLAFVQQHGGFQRDAAGSVRLGLLHGIYCIGCCWVLMALLFVGGVMNVLWIAGLTVLVLAEKVLPRGRIIARAAGIGMALAGVWLIATAKVISC